MMLNHLGTVTIETGRLLLRRFQLSDAGDVFRLWTGDEDVTKYLSWSAHGSVAHTKNYIGQCVKQYANKDFYYWCITPKDSGISVGFIGLVRVDENLCSASIAYALSKRYWNRGFATEATKAVLGFCFGRVGFNRISGEYNMQNPDSGKVLKKAGMKCEAMFRHAQKDNKGNLCDIAQYAVLSDEWMAPRPKDGPAQCLGAQCTEGES